MIRAPSISLRDVIDQLIAAGHLSADAATTISTALATAASDKSSPWYIQAITGIAAWLAVIPFIGFLFVVAGLESTPTMLVMAAFFLISAVALRNIFRKSLLVAQVALAFSLAGHVLLAIGLTDLLDSVAIVALFIIILEIILIALYPDGLHRFLSTTIIPGAILVILFDLEIQETIHILITALAAGAIALWEYESYLTTVTPPNLNRPLAYGLVVSLLYVLLLSIAGTFDAQLVEVYYWWVSTISLLLILLLLEYYILTSAQLAASPAITALIIIGTIIIFLPTMQVPGIVAAVLVLVLGFHRSNLNLIGLATAFLALFLIVFYYNLNLTLLTKSLMLMASGLALFGLRFLLSKQLAPTEVEA